MKRKIKGIGRGNPNPSPATRIKPGQRLPGAGKRKIPNSELIKYTAEMIAETIKKLHALTYPEVLLISQSNKVPALERAMARGIIADIKSANLYNFDRLLNRSIGAVAVKQELSGAGGIPLVPPTVIFEASAKKEEAK